MLDPEHAAPRRPDARPSASTVRSSRSGSSGSTRPRRSCSSPSGRRGRPRRRDRGPGAGGARLDRRPAREDRCGDRLVERVLETAGPARPGRADRALPRAGPGVLRERPQRPGHRPLRGVPRRARGPPGRRPGHASCSTRSTCRTRTATPATTGGRRRRWRTRCGATSRTSTGGCARSPTTRWRGSTARRGTPPRRWSTPTSRSSYRGQRNDWHAANAHLVRAHILLDDAQTDAAREALQATRRLYGSA